MAQFDKETLAIVKRLQMARLNLLRTQPFYALLLLHMTFSLDLTCETAYTDGMRIAFNPAFINMLSDRELEFVLMHEVLHVVLLHCFRQQSDYDQEAYDIACDIVVNSNILSSFHMDLSAITLKEFGESMHLAPNGDEGYLYTVDEVYQMVRKQLQKRQQRSKKQKNGGKGGRGKDQTGSSGNSKSGGRNDGAARFDDHTFWEGEDEDKTQNLSWLQRMIDATEVISKLQPGDGESGRGILPLGIEREIKEFKEPQTDWRTVLENFKQEEINDYSFSPPDRRFDDSPFFLPDYNEKEEIVKDILFMVDTSGSMSEEMITDAYSEIKGAIDQFGGKLQGWLGFFDGAVVEPKPFETEDEFKIIRPVGGGGTSFHIIFEYVQEKMAEEPPASIIILTDGYAPFPDEREANDIPVLWLINNQEVTPPWGKITRIKSES